VNATSKVVAVLDSLPPADFPKILRKLADAVDEHGAKEVLSMEAAYQGQDIGCNYAAFLTGAIAYYATGGEQLSEWRGLPAVDAEVLADAVGKDTSTEDEAGGRGPHQADPAGSSAAPTGSSEDSGPKVSWQAADWSAYLDLDVGRLSPELVTQLRVSFAKCVEAEDEGGEKKAKADKAWRTTVARVEAICLGLKTTKGEPLQWPCRGWRLPKLEGAVKEARDAARLSKSREGKPKPKPNNGYATLPKNEHGELVVPNLGRSMSMFDDGTTDEDWH